MKRKRILVTGESAIRVQKIRNIFSEDSFEIIHKVSNSKIIKELTNEDIDVMIVNLDMSLFAEYELVKEVRTDYTKDLIPIIVINDNADVGQKIDFLSLGADDYLYYPFNEKELYFRTINLIKRISRNRDVNPLTGLRGNAEIQNQISDNIQNGKGFAVLYCDLDNFKAYNDVYGFDNGDKVIKKVAEVLNNDVSYYGNTSDFIGHIGGDDFVIVTTPDRMDLLGNAIASDFDKKVMEFYTPQDREKGYITTQNREGQLKKFPLISISVAGVTSEIRRLICTAQVAEIAAEVKKYAKSIQGSTYVKDRRGK